MFKGELQKIWSEKFHENVRKFLSKITSMQELTLLKNSLPLVFLKESLENFQKNSFSENSFSEYLLRSNITRFFYKQHFYKQLQAEIDKKSSKC